MTMGLALLDGAPQQGQMFCSLCQIWSQDTPFISFVTLVSKNFAAYLRFLKWKPFLAFHFPQWGLKCSTRHDACVTINLDIAWLRLIQLPPPASSLGRHSLPSSKNFLRIFHGPDCERFVSHSTGFRIAKNLFMLCDCVWYSTYFTL